MKEDTIEQNISNSVKGFKDLSRTEHHRYLTFDFCYNYFRTNKDHLGGKNMEMSCYVLWSYLASWGMLRGSTFLLQKNPKFLVPLIDLIGGECKVLFDIDVDKYLEDGNIEKLVRCSKKIGEVVKDCSKKRNASITLITKIMLGVFACVPAYDGYFKGTFNKLIRSGEIDGGGFSSSKLSPKSLKTIALFYETYKDDIETPRETLYTNDFNSGKEKYQYSIAKVIDMYGFNAGYTKAKAEAAKKQQ